MHFVYQLHKQTYQLGSSALATRVPYRMRMWRDRKGWPSRLEPRAADTGPLSRARKSFNSGVAGLVGPKAQALDSGNRQAPLRQPACHLLQLATSLAIGYGVRYPAGNACTSALLSAVSGPSCWLVPNAGVQHLRAPARGPWHQQFSGKTSAPQGSRPRGGPQRKTSRWTFPCTYIVRLQHCP